LGDDRKEIRVVVPSGYNMLMQMSRDSRAGHFTLVHSDVETVVAGTSLQGGHCLLSQQRYLSHFFLSCLIVCVYVTIGANK
jgi:hypothetical protein